ncbi:hypothetical protein Tco_1412846, partial [Tanacetum coccineum]
REGKNKEPSSSSGKDFTSTPDAKDLYAVVNKGFFHRYSAITVLMILNHAARSELKFGLDISMQYNGSSSSFAHHMGSTSSEQAVGVKRLLFCGV